MLDAYEKNRQYRYEHAILQINSLIERAMATGMLRICYEYPKSEDNRRGNEDIINDVANHFRQNGWNVSVDNSSYYTGKMYLEPASKKKQKIVPVKDDSHIENKASIQLNKIDFSPLTRPFKTVWSLFVKVLS